MRKITTQNSDCETRSQAPSGEQGFMLLGLIVAIAIILMGLGVAASEAAFSIRRDREVESARRANQYVRAIRKFYLKNGNRYPGSVDQLDKGVGIRFLRQRYVDPLTGKADYRQIPVGQNKTTPKGFFGEPLAGIATTGLGSAVGMQSPGIGGPTLAPGTSAGPGSAGSTGSTGIFDSNGSSGTPSQTSPGSSTGFGGSSTGPGGSSLGSGSTSASQIGTGLPGLTGPFMGVGSSATGNSILVVNEQTSFDKWEFLYDPRIEKLKLAGAMNAGPGSIGAGSLGTTPGSLGPPNGANPLTPTSPDSGTPPSRGKTPPTP